MADRDPLSLDGVDSPGRRVEHDVDEAVVQKVDFVHIQNAAVGPGQQPGLVGLDPLSQRLFDVDGAADAVLGRAEGELDQRRLDLGRRERRLLSGLDAVEGPGPHPGQVGGVGVEGVVLDDVDLREELCDGADLQVVVVAVEFFFFFFFGERRRKKKGVRATFFLLLSLSL